MDNPTLSQQQTLNQRRARDARARVNDVSANAFKEYLSLVRSLPAMIQSDGLAASLTFLLAKGKPHHRLAYAHLSEWVLLEVTNTREGDLLDWLLDQNSAEYRRATSIARAYLVWLKRAAEGRNTLEEMN